MSAADQSLTLDEHRALGYELFETRNRVFTLGVEVSNRYRKSSTPSRRAQRAVQALDGLRCALDSQLALDHPDEFEPSVYYPGPKYEAMAGPPTPTQTTEE